MAHVQVCNARAGSKGIKNMQIFCFDMMLMRLCAKRNIGPGFLIHDFSLKRGGLFLQKIFHPS